MEFKRSYKNQTITITEQIPEFQTLLGKDNVFYIYDNKLNLDVKGLALEVSERRKNQDTLNLIYDYLIRKGANRKSTIVAIGGGVILDLVGYAAATFMRGVNLVNVPTTLLAMVDAAIGGKVGINYHEFKNYVGTFYLASQVIICPKFLKTLPKREYNAGMAEVIKYGAIMDRDFLVAILEGKLSELEIIKKAVDFKLAIVAEDEKDLGKRKMLNFGHTYGHAIESYYNFEKYLHGEAISIGMNMMCQDPLLKRVCQLYDLPTTLEEEINLDELVQRDKKNDGKKVFVRLKSLGEIDESTLT